MVKYLHGMNMVLRHMRMLAYGGLCTLLLVLPTSASAGVEGDAETRLGNLDPICNPSAQRALRTMAEDGDEDAQYYIATLLFGGICGERDEGAALVWMLGAARRGLVDAQHDYGRLMLAKATSDQERAEALYWLGAAAGQGDALSALVLGRLHETGMHGVEANACLALDWYHAGEALGSTDLVAHAERLSSSHDC
jgi:TPR repeat protein